MVDTRNIVFLGASYAGLGASHYFLKHVYPQLPNDSNVNYQVLIIDPSAKWYQRHAAPRAIANEEKAPAEKVFLEIELGYRQYGADATLIQGKAISWDDNGRTITIEKFDGSIEDISYWALILATGTRSSSPLFSLQGEAHTEVLNAQDTLHKRVASAREIIIAGGGPSGVETAGELGEYLNGAAGWFSSWPSNPKVKITLITGSSRLLPQLRESISDSAVKYLNRVGVEVRFNTKVIKSEELPNGKTRVILHDGEEQEPDIFIAALGVRPMSEYAPSHLKDKAGYIIQNESTLRIDAAGPRVYALGDIGTASNRSIYDIMQGLPVLEANLKRDLLAAHTDPNAKAEGQDKTYTRNEKELQIVPVGPSKGVGVVFGWRVPSWFVWLMKGRDYMIPKGPANVDGSNWKKP